MKNFSDRRPANPEFMKDLLVKSGIPVSEEQLEKLWAFHQFLRIKNVELNLTRIFNFENMVRKHYVDSLIILDILKKHKIKLPDVLMDLGTGPGFPGIPLAIFSPETRIALVEGRKNRCEFLEEAVSKAGLQNTEVIAKKVSSTFHYPVDGIITRAVASMYETFQRTTGCLKKDGLILFMKGPHCDSEIVEMRNADDCPCELLLDHTYTLPFSNDHRRLVVWRCEGTTSEALLSAERKTNPVVEIRSESNPKFKNIKQLNSGRQIKKQNSAIVGGRKIVREFFQENTDQVQAILVSSVDDEVPEIKELLGIDELPDETNNIPIWLIQPSLFREIDFVGAGSPQLLVSVPELPDFAGQSSAEDVVLMLPLSDPENLGAALRNAVAFSVRDVILLEEAAHPYHPKSIRASAGEVFHLNLYQGPSIQNLELDRSIYALDQNGEDIQKMELSENCAILVGMEGPGVPANRFIKKFRIPVSDQVESLNASVSLGIALYEFMERRKNEEPE